MAERIECPTSLPFGYETDYGIDDQDDENSYRFEDISGQPRYWRCDRQESDYDARKLFE